MQPLALDLRHYETVVAIVEFETMTEAAKHLAITQSALSHRLAEGERRLGTRLFERGPRRRLTPTRDGLALHQAASRALAELGRVEAHLLTSPTPDLTRLRIAVSGYDCYHWFPAFLQRTRRRHPEIDLDLEVIADSPGAALAAGTADIVLAPGSPEGDVELHHLFDDELVLITSPDHRLAPARRVTAEDLADETFLTYNAAPTPGFEYDRFVRPAGRFPRVVRVVRQTSAITELVAAGAGVAILSRWALTPAIEAGRIASARCGGGLDLPWHAVTRRAEEPARTIAGDLRDQLRVDRPGPVHAPASA